VSSHPASLPFPFLLLATFAAAFLFILLPISESIRPWRPDAVALLLVFWLVRTERLGIGFAWGTGLLYDGITGCYLGQHALAFSLIAYVVLIMRQSIRVFGALQQTALVFLLLLLDQMADSWFATVIYGDDTHFYFVINAALGALCWPVMIRLLDRYQR
jgi:rod shape-determining protein MreD